MNHKKRMKNLKKYDPITYSEMTSNPTGASGDEGMGCGIVMTLLTIALFIIVYVLF